MEIIKTSNLDIFKHSDKNRNIIPKHIKCLKESINRNNYLAINPIIVDENFVVLDGQHRLQACKEMGIPIYYIIAHGDSNQIIMELNAVQEKWKLNDFFKFYKDKPLIKFLLKENKRSGIKINALYFIGVHAQLNTITYQNKDLKKSLSMVFKNLDRVKMDYAFFESFIDYMMDIYLQMNLENDSSFLFFRNTTFIKCMYHFFKSEQVNKDYLRKKLVERHRLIPKFSNSRLIRQSLIEIYNYNKPENSRLKHDSNFSLKEV